jgi:hypothetical protein
MEVIMNKNMGTADRLIRALLVAPVLLIVAYLVGFATVIGVIAMVLGVVMLATAAVGFCPLYAPFHLRTDGHQKASA